jgi:hypothetical protein
VHFRDLGVDVVQSAGEIDIESELLIGDGDFIDCLGQDYGRSVLVGVLYRRNMLSAAPLNIVEWRGEKWLIKPSSRFRSVFRSDFYKYVCHVYI